MDLIARIRGMAGFCDVEAISKAIGIPVTIINGVLNGEINEDVLTEYDPARPPEIKIVEKKKYVRSRTIGVISTGGCGATTITAVLGIQISCNSDSSVLLVDLNEFANLSSVLGMEKEAMLPSVLGWARGCDIHDLYRPHPCRPNLYMISGTKDVKDYISCLPDKLPALIKAASRSFDIVLLDCPTTPFLWDKVFPELDMIFLVLRPDEASLVNMVYNLSSFMTSYKEKLFLIFNFVGMDNNLPQSDYKYFAKSLEIPVVAEVPENSEVRKAIHSVAIKYPAIEIEKSLAKELEGITGMLCSGKTRQQPGLLKRLFAK